MTRQEIRIQTRIIHELSCFMMMNGQDAFSISVEKQQGRTHFVLRLGSIEAPLLERIKEKVNQPREIEVETYGWELVGDHDTKSEFKILGLLVDYMRVECTEDAVV